jgi:hypothetical protein
MTWTKLHNGSIGARHTGLELWIRARQTKRFIACITREVAAWFGTSRVAMHVDASRSLVAICASNEERDALIRTQCGGGNVISVTPLVHRFPEVVGQSFRLTEAHEPGLGRCLLFSVNKTSQSNPDVEQQDKPAPEPMDNTLLSSTRFDGRQRIATYVLESLSEGTPVSAAHCRKLGRQHHLTEAEATAAMNLAMDRRGASR